MAFSEREFESPTIHCRQPSFGTVAGQMGQQYDGRTLRSLRRGRSSILRCSTGVVRRAKGRPQYAGARRTSPTHGGVAQLVVQQLCKLKTVGSSPIASTICPISSVVEHSPGTGEVASSILVAGSDLSMTRFIQIDRVASGENRTCSPAS